MHDAIDRNDITVEASDVSKDYKRHGEAWLDQRRKEGFWCGSCLTPVYFVRGALGAHGRAAHFKVSKKTPHTEDACGTTAGVTSSTSNLGTVQMQPGVMNTGQVLAITYTMPRPLGYAGSSSASSGLTAASAKTTTQYVPGGGTPNNQGSTGLRASLSSLRSIPSFPDPDLRLHVTSRGEMLATDYFRHFSHATNADAINLPGKQHSTLRAYWGTIDTVEEGGSLFLKGNGMSAMVLPKHIGQLKAAFQITDWLQLKDWDVLAEGRLASDVQNKLYVRVNELNRLVLLPPKT
jgi:hypothetical protein